MRVYKGRKTGSTCSSSGSSNSIRLNDWLRKTPLK